MKKIGMIILILTLILSGCSAVAPAVEAPTGDTAAPIPVTLGVGFIPNVQFAPLYVGIAQGFFAAEGLDVSLDYGFENDYLKLVGTDAFQFMVGSGDQVVLGQAQGLPVRYVLNWYTRYPVVVFAKADAGINTPADLAGKTIGLPGLFGANYVAFRGILEAAGLTEADVQAESIGFTQAAAISQGTVDAAVDYGVNGPVILAQEGIATTQIALDGYLSIPANGLVTNQKTIDANPDLVARMVRATQTAIAFTLANPDQAFKDTLAFVPEAGGDNETANRAVFDAVLAYWTLTEGAQPGATTLAQWQSAAELMQRIGLVDTLVPAEGMFTNEFLGR